MDGSIADVIPCYHKLLGTLEGLRRTYQKRKDANGKLLYQGINAAWNKLNKYYTLTDLSPVYMVAVICDPRKKIQWIQWAWEDRPDWIELAKQTVKEVFDQYVEKYAPTDGLLEANTVEDVTWLSWPENDSVRAQTVYDEEFASYMSLPNINGKGDPMQFWRDNGERFPIWQRIAYDFLSVPAMSAEIERVWSRFPLILHIED
jgi:hAT family C-terminal dimerisation region/Domain of unknown function (DUF4413)